MRRYRSDCYRTVTMQRVCKKLLGIDSNAAVLRLGANFSHYPSRPARLGGRNCEMHRAIAADTECCTEGWRTGFRSAAVPITRHAPQTVSKGSEPPRRCAASHTHQHTAEPLRTAQLVPGASRERQRRSDAAMRHYCGSFGDLHRIVLARVDSIRSDATMILARR